MKNLIKSTLFLLLLRVFSYSNEIIISQVGYSKYEEKLAYFCSTKETSDLFFYILDKDTKKELIKGTMSFYGDYYNKYFYIIDFTSLNEGSYVLKTNNLEVPFTVSRQIYKKFYLDTIKHYFYIQRCGVEIPMWHKACHLDDGIVPAIDKKLIDSLILNQPPSYPAGTHIDVVGGWHDAGDYNKYMGNLAVVVGILGLAFEEFKLDDDTNNNKIPDLLEELEYGIKWMLKMQDKDGGVFERVFSGYEYKGLPEKETDNKPKTSDDRFLDIDKYTDVTSKFVAACAIAYRIFKNYNENFSQKILQAAIKGWDWIKKNPNKYDTEPWSFGRYPGDKSATVWAAVEMYQSTKNFEYLDFAERRVLEIKTVNGSLNHMSWIFQPVVGLSKLYLFTNHDGIKKVVLRELNRYLKKYIEVATENPFYIRTGFIDAWEWGTNGIILGSGFDLYWISKVLNDGSVLGLAAKLRQWVLGLNYIGKSFVVGVGNSIENPYSLLVQSVKNNKRILGAVVPGLYISQGKPFYTEQQGSFKCNEATIDAAALYVFNLGIPESEVCFSLISPLRNSTVKGKLNLEVEVLSDLKIDKVEYKIDEDNSFKSLSLKKDNIYHTEIDTTLLYDGEHIIYIRALKDGKPVGGTIFKINVDNIKEPLKIFILQPQPYTSYIGGFEILCKLNSQDLASYELYYTLDNKTYNKLSFKDKKFFSEVIPSKTGEIDLVIKAVNIKTSEEFKTDKIKIFVSRSGQLQTEENFRVIEDKSQTPISQEKRKYDDSGCVVLPDEGDEIAIDFYVCEEGNYILRHRERSGDTYWKSPTSRWDQNTYEYKLDGKIINLNRKDDTTTKEADLYGEYWGIRETEKLYLNKGKHTFCIKTKQVWAYSDYLDVVSEKDLEKKFIQPQIKILDNFEKTKLDWGSYKGSASELNMQISSLNQKWGENSLKVDFLNKDYLGVVYNNKVDWSEYKNVEMWIYSTEKTKIHFVIEERKEKTFWGLDQEISETNKWVNIKLPFDSFSVDTGYQPGNKDDKVLNLEDIMTFHISPRSPMDKKCTIFIDDLKLTK